MSKVYFLLVVVMVVMYSCKHTSVISKQKKIINETIKAIRNNDMNRIYNLIDTSSYIKVNGKESFEYLINYLNTEFDKCEMSIVDSIIKVSSDSIYSMQSYTYPYCRNDKGYLKENSFDVIFTFRLYGDIYKIYFIDIVKYNKNEPVPISIP